MRLRPLFLLPVLLALAAPAAANPARLKTLTDMFELNEASYAWLHHCDNFDARMKERPQFMENTEATLEALAKEMVVEDPKLTLEDARKDIAQRELKLSETYGNLFREDGCATEKAKAIQRHYETFSRSPPDFYKRFLDSFVD